MRTAESADLDSSIDLNAMQSVLGEHPVRLAIIFGSHATETTHATSDIDLAVEFEDRQPADSSYNDTFLGLSVDLSESLNTDTIDLVDLQTVSPALATAIFENGILIMGDQGRARTLREKLTSAESERQSPRERLDAALEKIDAHLGSGETGVPAAGDRGDDG